MTEKTMTRARLTEAVHRDVGLTRQECAEMVDGFFELLCRTLERGEDVKISSFGAFILRDKAARMGRNPETNQLVPIAPRRVVTFRPSAVLKARIDQGCATLYGEGDNS